MKKERATCWDRPELACLNMVIGEKASDIPWYNIDEVKILHYDDVCRAFGEEFKHHPMLSDVEKWLEELGYTQEYDANGDLFFFSDNVTPELINDFSALVREIEIMNDEGYNDPHMMWLYSELLNDSYPKFSKFMSALSNLRKFAENIAP